MSSHQKIVIDLDEKRILTDEEAQGFTTKGMVGTVGSVPSRDRKRRLLDRTRPWIDKAAGLFSHVRAATRKKVA